MRSVRMYQSWDRINIREIDFPGLEQTIHVGQTVKVVMKVELGSIDPNDIEVEVVSGHLNSQEQFLDLRPVAANLNGMPAEDGVYSYEASVSCHESGRFGITARVVPKNENLLHVRKPKLISWW